jgi:hypothetical protein
MEADETLVLSGALVLPVVECGRQIRGQSEGIVAGAGPSRYVAAMQHEGDMGNAETCKKMKLALRGSRLLFACMCCGVRGL